jgi:hypothetical protein
LLLKFWSRDCCDNVDTLKDSANRHDHGNNQIYGGDGLG